jgi:hypothetical protein
MAAVNEKNKKIRTQILRIARIYTDLRFGKKVY